MGKYRSRRRLKPVLRPAWLLLLLVSISPLSNVSAQPVVRLEHLPLVQVEPGSPIKIDVTCEVIVGRVEYFRLFFRRSGEPDYQYVEMLSDLDLYSAEIPAEIVTEGEIHYFISAIFSDGSERSLPAADPARSPYRINVMPADEEKRVVALPNAPVVTLLAPDETKTVPPDEVLIAFSLYDPDDDIDLRSIRITLDEVNVTPRCQISPVLISFVPDRLANGPHIIEMELSDEQGNTPARTEWEFNVGRVEPIFPVTFRGRTSIELRQENVQDVSTLFNRADVNVSGTAGPVNYQGRLFLTSEESLRRQHQNRYKWRFSSRWGELNLGDTSPRLNRLMLWGKRIRGVHASARVGRVHLDYVQGSILRPIEGRFSRTYFTDANGDTLYLTARGDTVTTPTGAYLAEDDVTNYGTYQRNLFAIRGAFGGGQRFLGGFTLLKVRDDINSIDYGIKPKENLCLGTDFRAYWDNRRITLDGDLAFSLLANDIAGGAVSKADLDSIGIDIPVDPATYESFFTINTSVIPLDPTKRTSIAYDLGLSLNYFRNLLEIRRTSHGPDYNSLGNTFIRRDQSGWIISDRVRLLRNMVYLTANFERLSDNMANTKPFTTASRSFNYNLVLYPAPGLPSLNFGYKTYTVDNGITAIDTLFNEITGGVDSTDIRDKNTTLSTTFSTSYRLLTSGLNHTLTLSFVKSNKSDRYRESRMMDFQSSAFVNDIAIFSLRTKYKIPLTTNITYASTDNSQRGGVDKIRFRAYNLFAEYKLFDGRMNTFCSWKLTAAGGQLIFKRNNLSLGMTYTISRKQTLTSTFNLFRTDFQDKNRPDSMDRIIHVRYERSF
ncbi:hypothetical protein ACFLT7_00100 [candidate division KSB1 bacterium]